MSRPDVAIVHDYLTQRGGAERVVLAMARAFPDAPIHTSVYRPETTYADFRFRDVRTLWTDRLRPLRVNHRHGLPLYPVAFSSARVDADVTLCSSSGFAHAVRTGGRKLVYCHSPARWLYDEADNYLQGWPAPVRLGLRGAAPALRAWDRRGMAGAERLFANSSAVAARIRSTYGVDADVLPPPAGVNARGPQRAIPGIEPGFVLSVGRLLAYKNVDALVTAAGHVPGCRLVVAGDGPERARLQAAAGPEVVFTGEVADAELRWLYANCAGVASASREDYGLTPLEAAVHGRPAATLRFGGFLDTVAEGETGVFFDTPDVGAVSAALTRMITTDWERDRIMAQATTFGEDAFCAHLRTAVATVATRGAPVPKPDLAPARRSPAPKLARRSARAHG